MDDQRLFGARNRFLFSIHGRFSNLLLSGKKKAEFRRKIPKDLQPGDIVYIYETSPVKKITGCFTVKKIGHYSSWNGFETFENCERDLIALAAEGCLTEQELINYASTAEDGGNYVSFYAIFVSSPIRFDQPKDLSFVNIVHAPQNFLQIREVKENG